MKTQITAFIAVSALLLTVNGCSKKEDAGGAIEKATATAEGQTEVVKSKTADAIANVAEKSAAAAAQVQSAAKAQLDAQSSQVQSLIEQAGKLLGENKSSEALALLNQLAGKSLTPEQQSLVQRLTGQAQKAGQAAVQTKAVDEATKSVGGLLPKK